MILLQARDFLVRYPQLIRLPARQRCVAGHGPSHRVLTPLVDELAQLLASNLFVRDVQISLPFEPVVVVPAHVSSASDRTQLRSGGILNEIGAKRLPVE